MEDRYEGEAGAEAVVLAPDGKYVFETLDGSGNPLKITWYEENA